MMTTNLSTIVQTLGTTGPVLQELFAAAPSELTFARESDDVWSPYEVVEHLVLAEQKAWIPRARLLLEQDRPPFPAFDRYAHLRWARRDVMAAIEDFQRHRAVSMDTLNGWSLTQEALQRVAIHPEFGEVTLAQLLSTWAAHDLGHLTQILRTMARAYRPSVGPWTSYLSVMKSADP